MRLQERDTKMSSKCSWMKGLILMWKTRVDILHFIWPLNTTTKMWNNCFLRRGQSHIWSILDLDPVRSAIVTPREVLRFQTLIKIRNKVFKCLLIPNPDSDPVKSEIITPLTWILLKLISLHAGLFSDTSLMTSSTLAPLGSGSGYFFSLVASQWSWEPIQQKKNCLQFSL